MAIFPTYEGKANFQPQAAAPIMTGAEQGMEAAVNLGKVVIDASQKWTEAADLMDYTKFKATTATQIAQQKALAEDDPDENNLKTHTDALANIKKNAQGMVGNSMLAMKANQELDGHIATASAEIDGAFKKKRIITNQMNLVLSVKSAAEERNKAQTPEQAKKIDADTISLIKGQAARGLITEPFARKQIDDYRLGKVDLDIMNDAAISKDESFVYQQLKAGDKGVYNDLDDSERADRLEKVELHIRRNKIMADFSTNKNQDETEKNLLLQHGNPAIPITGVRDLLIATKIRPAFGDKYMTAMYTLPAQVTDHTAYNKIKMAQLDGKSQKDINALVLDHVGDLTAEDKNKILGSSYDGLDKKTITIKASAIALKTWGDDTFKSLILGDKEGQEIVFNFLQRAEANPNANIDEVIKGVQTDYIKKNYPETTLLQDVPNIIGNRNKIQKVYEKESKAAGKKAQVKPVSSVYQNMNVGFDDL